jgi:hypothetical protein
LTYVNRITLFDPRARTDGTTCGRGEIARKRL